MLLDRVADLFGWEPVTGFALEVADVLSDHDAVRAFAFGNEGDITVVTLELTRPDRFRSVCMSVIRFTEYARGLTCYQFDETDGRLRCDFLTVMPGRPGVRYRFLARGRSDS